MASVFIIIQYCKFELRLDLTEATVHNGMVIYRFRKMPNSCSEWPTIQMLEFRDAMFFESMNGFNRQDVWTLILTLKVKKNRTIDKIPRKLLDFIPGTKLEAIWIFAVDCE